MIVVGTSHLAAFGARHPASAGPLRALNALLVHARWDGPDDIARDCGAVMTRSGDDIVLDLAGAGFRVTIRVNHALGVVRVRRVEELSR